MITVHKFIKGWKSPGGTTTPRHELISHVKAGRFSDASHQLGRASRLTFDHTIKHWDLSLLWLTTSFLLAKSHPKIFCAAIGANVLFNSKRPKKLTNGSIYRLGGFALLSYLVAKRPVLGSAAAIWGGMAIGTYLRKPANPE